MQMFFNGDVILTVAKANKNVGDNSLLCSGMRQFAVRAELFHCWYSKGTISNFQFRHCQVSHLTMLVFFFVR